MSTPEFLDPSTDPDNYDVELFYYMAAYDDDDAPDGAWEAKLKDSVYFYNQANGTLYDEHDTWMAYVTWKRLQK